jgi:hypothetical protein
MISGNETPIRIGHGILGILYTMLFYFCYRYYITQEWAYMGLVFREMSYFAWLYIFTSTFLVSMFIPFRFDRPSSVLMFMIYLFVFVPTNLLTPIVGSRDFSFYFPTLAVMAITLIVGGMIIPNRPSPVDPVLMKRLSTIMEFGFLAIFSVSFLLLFTRYSDVLQFSGLDEIYTQRELAGRLAGGFIDYVRTYFSYVFNVAILAFGFVGKRKVLMFPIAILGFVFSFTIDASKISFLVPLIMLAFLVIMKFWNSSVTAFMVFWNVMIFFVSWLSISRSSLTIVFDLITIRSLALPGQTISLYLDLFYDKGFTWWSNVRGISTFVPPPAAFASDPYWPELGRIVGADYFGIASNLNFNANFFAGEGAAAGGWLGAAVIGVIFLFWIYIFDQAAKGWDRKFVVLITVPLGLALSNIHLSTLLLSFGGIFWPLFLYFLPRIVKKY